MLEARKAYISQNNEFYRKRDKKLTDYSNDCTSILKKYPDNDLLNSWSTMEKDTLKKHLLQFGYGRWKKIRKFSASQDKILMNKNDREMKAFSNDFIRTLFEFLQ